MKWKEEMEKMMKGIKQKKDNVENVALRINQ